MNSLRFHQFCRSSEAVAQLPHPAPEAEGAGCCVGCKCRGWKWGRIEEMKQAC